MKKKFNGVWLILSAAILWGTAGVFVKGFSKFGISGINIVFLRAFFTVLILTPYILIKNKTLFRVKIKDIWIFAANGIFSIVMFNFCYYKTMEISSLSVAAVLLYTAPFFVMLISALFYKEKITLIKLFSCITAFVGCCMVSGLFSGGNNFNLECVCYGLLTGFGYALYSIFGNILLKREYESLTITYYAFFFSMIGSAFLFDYKNISPYFFNGQVIFLSIGIALLNTVIPYILYTNGLRSVSLGKAPIIATVEPVVATLMGMIYGEYPDMLGLFGIVLVLSSVIILNIKRGEHDEDQSICKD